MFYDTATTGRSAQILVDRYPIPGIPLADAPVTGLVTDDDGASAAVPSRLGPTLAVDSVDGWVRWSRFEYELPRDHAGRRRSLWRQLRRTGALKLLPGEWAVAHGEDGDAGVDELVDAVRAAGGSASLQEVGRSGVDEVEQQVRLCRRCESLWDPFFNTADRVARSRRGGLGPDDLDRLRRRYADELGADVVLSDAASRAARLLDELGERVGEQHGRNGARPPRPTVVVTAAHALDDGAARYVTRVEPFPDLATERAFNAFEASVYQPSARRVPLRHGVFVFTVERDARDAVLASLRDRFLTFSSCPT